MEKPMNLKPVIKWAGGKGKIIEHFFSLYEISNTDRYIDLFCGSLSIPILLGISKPMILNDINSALINMYVVIKDSLPALIKELDKLDSDKYNSKEQYNLLRNEYNICKKNSTRTRKSKIRYASLFIYLNKRSYNGLYRENRNGEYNVPYREYNTSIYSKNDLQKLSDYFNEQDITFHNLDYTEFNLDDFRNGDLIYIDPPYYPSKKSQFTSYWKKPFLVEEQEKLAEFCKALDKKGIKFILSNSPCDEIQKLYSEFNQHIFYIGRQMRSGKGKSDVFDKRQEPNEILVWNFSGIKIEK